MTDLNKRRLMQAAGLATLASAAALVGCGKKEAPAPTAAAPAAASAPAPKPEPLKVAFVYVGPVGDAGWTFAHDQGRKAVEAEFGDKVKTTYVEKVPEGADAERVFRDLAAQGNKLIFATSFGFMEPMLKVAAEFPDVKFEHCTGYKTAPNMSVYDARFYHDAYVSGVIAGGMTKTNTLGFVASFPIPEVLRNINAFTLGAQSVNPKVKTKVVWVSTWYDPPKESDAAQTLINQGADVLLQNTDSTAVLLAAEKNNKFAFGWDSDMSAVAPKAHLASNVVYWGPYYIKTVKAVMDGTWKGGERTIWGKPEGANDVIKFNGALPEAVRKKAEEALAGLKAGSLNPFTGPIVDSTGKERLPKGTGADQAWKDKVDFYVKGVEGKVPSGK
ncbi:MAG: BMP family ABC transporter substrate-binding protein [Betaproteobacteria bacterium]|nr:BMP family ABC transporter substrate-binding protein [Betaproteobacteria bacterium]